MIPKNVILLLSGGLDSTVLLYDLLSQGCNVHCVLFNYGQRHSNRELSAATSLLTEMNYYRRLAQMQEVLWSEIRLPRLNGSSLTDGTGSKVVPNRNAVLLSVSVSIAVQAKAESVVYACNKDDEKDFPDCRKEFVNAICSASMLGAGVEICAPYIDLSKREIVQIGRRLDVPLEKTWSCYSGGFAPCGACDACIKRMEAMV